MVDVSHWNLHKILSILRGGGNPVVGLPGIGKHLILIPFVANHIVIKLGEPYPESAAISAAFVQK